jgi:hypothetical protein
MITRTAPWDKRTSEYQPPVVMTESQLRGMLKFAIKAETAYRACGDSANAEQAQAHREWLEMQLEERKAAELVVDLIPQVEKLQQALYAVSCMSDSDRAYYNSNGNLMIVRDL